MAMTQSALLFVAGLATLATLGLFYRFDDEWTGVLVGFGAAVLWAIVGVSSFKVTVPGESVVYTFEMMPLVIIGIGMAIVTALFAVSDMLQALKTDTTNARSDSVMGGR